MTTEPSAKNRGFDTDNLRPFFNGSRCALIGNKSFWLQFYATHMLINRSEKRSFYAPTLCQSFLDRSNPYPYFSAPIGQTESFAVDSIRSVSPRVSHLLRAAYPLAVSGFIISTIVDALKRKVGWARSHVSQEYIKIISPLFAHHYPATTVTKITRVIRIAATVFCRAPATILARLAVRPCVSVRISFPVRHNHLHDSWLHLKVRGSRSGVPGFGCTALAARMNLSQVGIY